MKPLNSLIELAHLEDKIGHITLRFGFEEPDSNKGRNYVYKWQASLLDALDGFLAGDGENTIENACTSLLSMCKERYSYFSVSRQDIVYDPDQIEKILLQIKTISSNLGNAFISLSFTYSPPFKQYSSIWEAQVTEGSHWHNRSIIKIQGASFNEVCQELWGNLQKLQSNNG